MVKIVVERGLDIPIEGLPQGPAQPLIPGGEVSVRRPRLIALNVSPFEELRFRLLKREGETVSTGTPLLEDKAAPGRYFVSPATGTVKELRRGLKRRLLDVVIETDKEEQFEALEPLDPKSASREELIAALLKGGAFAHLHRRPFNLLADPKERPRAIFVKALESAPFLPPAELQIEGYEAQFAAGLEALQRLTDGAVHLVYREGTPCQAFLAATGVEHHTVQGPHPAANHSLHIQKISPIRGCDDVVWTASARDVALIGHLLTKGRYLTDRVVSIAGPAIVPDRVGYFKVRSGFPIQDLIADRLVKGKVRLISGDPLMGTEVTAQGFLGFGDCAFCAFFESEGRELFHFLRLGINKYSFSRAYPSGHRKRGGKLYSFTTSLHGEKRAFIDATLYDKVMPLELPTMQLVKAVMAEDYDLAEALGLLDVDGEDFALPTFVCPSKMEMVEIIRQGLADHAKEVLA